MPQTDIGKALEILSFDLEQRVCESFNSHKIPTKNLTHAQAIFILTALGVAVGEMTKMIDNLAGLETYQGLDIITRVSHQMYDQKGEK